MKILLAVVIFFFVSAVYGESPLIDPQIPNGESLRYRITEDDQISYSTQEIFREDNVFGLMYSIFTKSDIQDSNLWVHRSGLLPYKSSVVNRINGAEYSTETVIQKIPEFSSDSIAVIGFADLVHVLRGFPFKAGNKLKMRTLGQNQDDEMFSMEIHYQKSETIKIDGAAYQTYKLQLVPQITGFLNIIVGMFPKTYFWYSTEKPHILIRYEGSAGFGGDKQVIELVVSSW